MPKPKKPPAHVAGAENKQPHATCGAKAKGGPCRSRPVKGAKRCRMHGGKGSGAPKGNQNAAGHGAPTGNDNARTHGLFSASLGPEGKAAYDKARELAPDVLAREAADFAIAKVAEAFGGGVEVRGAIALVEEYLGQLVEMERISFDAKTFIMRRLSEPDIAMLGKALGPLKSLLEVKKPKKTDGESPALEVLSGVVKRSQARRDAEQAAKE